MSIKVVFLDCDGTLTNVKSSWQYLHERLNLWDENADEFQRLFRVGEIDYHEFCRRDAALWKGLSEERVLGIVGEISYRKGVRETVRALKSEGILTVILSTGLALLVDRVRSELDVTFAAANELIIREGVVTGEIKINVDHDRGHQSRAPSQRIDGTPVSFNEPHDKAYWVRSFLEARGIRREESAAVGDGEGDLGMFGAVGLAIGYHPSTSIIPLLDHTLHDGSFIKILEVVRART